jgi:hypothetical protein
MPSMMSWPKLPLPLQTAKQAEKNFTLVANDRSLILFPPIDPDLVGDRYLNGYVLLYGCPLPLLGPCVVMSQSPIWDMFY